MVIISKKNRKIQWLIITPLFGVKIGRYRGKNGPVAHNYPATKWPPWGNIEPYRKGMISICWTFSQDFVYVLDTLVLRYTL